MKLYKAIIPVSDIDQAERFYSQLLEMPGRRVSPGRHHFDCGEMVLTCYDPGAEGEEDASAVPPNTQPLYFATADLEATFERAQAADCESLDEQIARQPWGDRSFCALDPFGNLIAFVDEATVERQKGERAQGGPEDRLSPGLAVFVQPAQSEVQERIGACVIKIFSDEIWLEFSASSPEAVFKERQSVKLHFADENGVYLADTQIVKVAPENQHVAVAIPEKATSVQRRAAPRVAVEIPISFSVVGSAEHEGEVFTSQTLDLSTGGARLETPTSLKEGDQLQMNLSLAPSEEIKVSAKVISVERVQRETQVLTSMRVQFVELKLDDQIKILQFLIDSQTSELEDQETKHS